MQKKPDKCNRNLGSTTVLTIILLVLTISLLSSLPVSLNSTSILKQSPPNSAFKPHGPINIWADSMFTSLGFPGVGTPDNPYIISGWDFSEYIWISYTNAHFIIKNCRFIRNGLQSMAIYIKEGASNGTIVNNEFHGYTYAILLENTTNMDILSNYMSNNTGGIHFFNDPSTNVLIRGNIIVNPYYQPASYRTMGITLWGSNCSIENNYVRGHEWGISLHNLNSSNLMRNTLIKNLENFVIDGVNNGNLIINNTLITLLQAIINIRSQNMTYTNEQLKYLPRFDNLDVTFFDNSTGGTAPISRQWSFGDGSANATVANPIHHFAQAGDYNVTLTIIDADGDISVTSFILFLSTPTITTCTTEGEIPNASIDGYNIWVLFLTLVLGLVYLKKSPIRKP
jgi:parallel beta-helix repeat protein